MAMKRWYINLPKYSRESRKVLNGKDVYKSNFLILKSLSRGDSGQKLLFEDIPSACDTSDYSECVARVEEFKEFYDDALNELIDSIIIYLKNKFCLNETLINKMSLSSIIKDWCEKLDSSVYNQLFSDGTDRCLQLFLKITNDENEFVSSLARLATDLRLEDWTEDTINTFKNSIEKYKNTAESFVSNDNSVSSESDANSYQVSFVSEDGNVVTKRFERTETSKRGKLLSNQMQASIDSMGQSISEQEKRQIIIDILNKLC